MKAQRAVLKGVRHLEFEEIELPSLTPTAVLARTLYSAVSTGTEVAAYTGAPPLRPGPIYPRKVGYCNAAQIVAVGAEVKEFSPGCHILTSQSHQSAFVCEASEVLATIPERVSPQAASLAYLAHLGQTALDTGHVQASKPPVPKCPIAVMGLGVIGLATIAMGARIAGTEMIAIGNDLTRLDLARRLGAERCYLADDPRLAGEEPRVIVTTVNSWSAWKLALGIARFRTRVVVLGFPGRAEGAPNFNPLGSEFFYEKQLCIFAAGMLEEPGKRGRLVRWNLNFILHMLTHGQLPLAELISHRVPWHQLGTLYDLAAARDKSLVAGVLDWSTAP